MGLQQKWGAVNFSVSGSHFFHDFSKNNLGVWANVRLNLFKGFQFRIGGGARLIRDQLSLPKAGATDEDILLQQRQLATNYRYHSNIGITYTFGSIYNTVVNPRFGD